MGVSMVGVGAWGPGLYQNDTALDLKAVVRSVLRLPLSPDQVIEAISQYNPSLQNPSSSDHTTSWFVLADMFHRYGLQHLPTIDRVKHYVDDGRDLTLMAELGMDDRSLRKRSQALQSLVAKISVPNEKPTKRRVLRKPQPLLFDGGDVVAYPAQNGTSANPYSSSWESFEPDGYLAGLIVDVGHSFGFLAWYSFSLVDRIFPSIPSSHDCLDQELYGKVYGTLTALHVKRMQMSKIGHFDLREDLHHLQHRPSGTPLYTSPEYVVTSDIGLDTNLPGGGRTILRDLSGVNLRSVVVMEG